MPPEPEDRRHRAARRSISVIAPTYNERGNIRRLVAALDSVLGELDWELIVVDDDSPDRTYEVAADCAREGWPVRCIRRVGRRGLSSAVVEGALASSADCLVVMDADMQHDETVIPAMADQVLYAGADLVVASRHLPGGGLGEWDERRRRMSSMATQASKILVGARLSDPMSGFFAIRRDVFLEQVYGLSQQGYKILVDIVSSAARPLNIVEIPYVFRNREAGASKLDAMVMVEFALMIVDKLSSGLVPPKLVLFLAVGLIGLGCHLIALQAARWAGLDFIPAQIAATLLAMSSNYLLNNNLTYRAERLRGLDFVGGYIVFCVICTLGAVANISVANTVIHWDHSWPLAGLAGAVMSAVFNFEVASRLVWGGGRRRRLSQAMGAWRRISGARPRPEVRPSSLIAEKRRP